VQPPTSIKCSNKKQLIHTQIAGHLVSHISQLSNHQTNKFARSFPVKNYRHENKDSFEPFCGCKSKLILSYCGVQTSNVTLHIHCVE